MNFLSTGQIAKRAHVTKETLRYYERKGLIPLPPRTESGYRVYDEGAVKRILFIKNAQSLGFTLKEIQELLNLRVERKNTCSEVNRKTNEKIYLIEEKIKNLTMIRDSLKKLADTCQLKKKTSSCPILDYFDEPDRSGNTL